MTPQQPKSIPPYNALAWAHTPRPDIVPPTPVYPPVQRTQRIPTIPEWSGDIPPNLIPTPPSDMTASVLPAARVLDHSRDTNPHLPDVNLPLSRESLTISDRLRRLQGPMDLTPCYPFRAGFGPPFGGQWAMEHWCRVLHRAYAYNGRFANGPFPCPECGRTAFRTYLDQLTWNVTRTMFSRMQICIIYVKVFVGWMNNYG